MGSKITADRDCSHEIKRRLLVGGKAKQHIKKFLNDWDKHGDVVTYLELNILECEVKWVLESITMNKANGGDRIPAELFQILKLLLKCCTQYVSKFGKFSSGHRTRKGQFSFQFQRKAMPKNVQATILSHLFHMLARLCTKSFKLGFNINEVRTSRCTSIM